MDKEYKTVYLKDAVIMCDNLDDLKSRILPMMNNKKLKLLNCGSNDISEFNLSNNILLESVYVNNMKLTSLIVN